MVWGGSCGQKWTDLIVAHGGHTRYWNMFFVVTSIHLRYEWSYMKSHISPQCCCELWYYHFMGFIEYTRVYLLSNYYTVNLAYNVPVGTSFFLSVIYEIRIMRISYFVRYTYIPYFVCYRHQPYFVVAHACHGQRGGGGGGEDRKIEL